MKNETLVEENCYDTSTDNSISSSSSSSSVEETSTNPKTEEHEHEEKDNEDQEESNMMMMIDVPSTLICPLTLEIMSDPVMSKYGHSYERKAIMDWFCSGQNGDVCPLTRRPLHIRDLVSNHALRIQIDEWLYNLIKNNDKSGQHHQPIEQEEELQQQHDESGTPLYRFVSVDEETESSCSSETLESLILLHEERMKERERKKKKSNTDKDNKDTNNTNAIVLDEDDEPQIYGFIAIPPSSRILLPQQQQQQHQQRQRASYFLQYTDNNANTSTNTTTINTNNYNQRRRHRHNPQRNPRNRNQSHRQYRAVQLNNILNRFRLTKNSANAATDTNDNRTMQQVQNN